VTTTKKRVHVVVSVDIDRFSDRDLEKKWLPTFAQLGAMNAADIRRICREARAGGLEAFPSCDHHDEKGYCLGHEEVASDCEPGAFGATHRCARHEGRLLNADGRCGA
jgi:hypothetical protein